MNNEQILKKAVEKAVKNGYDLRGCANFVVETDAYGGLNDLKKLGYEIEPDTSIYFILPQSKGGNKIEIDLYNLIFSHDFAKAFWGEDDLAKAHKHKHQGDYDCGAHHMECDTAWQYHLQQMVLKEDPIKYLEQFLQP